jgi:hypothetical protein
MRDDGPLANFAAVSFDPKTDGTVTAFTITNVSEPKVEPMPFKELTKALEDAQAADKDFSDRRRPTRTAMRTR